MRTVFHGEVLTATQTADNATTREFLAEVAARLGETAVPDGQRTRMALDYLSRVVEAQALTLGFKDAFVALGIVFLLALVPAWIFSRTRRPAAE